MSSSRAQSTIIVASQSGRVPSPRVVAAIGLLIGLSVAADCSALTSQSISFGAPPNVVVGGSGSVAAAASSDLPVVLSSYTPATCTVAGSTVSGVSAGPCYILANQAGNASYAAALQQVLAITVASATTALPTCTIATSPANATVNVGATVSLAASCQNALGYRWEQDGVAVGSTANYTTPASLAIGSYAYKLTASNTAGTTTATATVVITGAAQTISFGAAPTLLPGGSATVSATASSGLPVALSSYTPSICTIAGNTVSALAAGRCYIIANQAGNASYAAAPQQALGITIGQAAAPTCTLSADPAAVSAGGATTLTASCSPEAASYVWTGGSCAGVPFPGTATCHMHQTATTTYTVTGTNSAGTGNTASVTVTMITGAAQTITFGAAPTLLPGGSATVSATASSGLPVALSSYTPTICTISGNTVSAIAAGRCYIIANQAGNASYAAAPQQALGITIGQAEPPTCTLAASPATITAGSHALLTASCSPAATSYLWSTNTTFGSTVASGTVAPTTTTTYTVTGVNASGTGSAASVAVAVTPRETPPVCSLTAAPDAIVAGASATLTASCSPTATSYAWSGSGCAGTTGPTCSVTPTATSSYAVVGSNSAGSGAPSSASVTVRAAAAAFSGLWWNPNESGWGLSVTQHGSMSFVAIFTFEPSGQATWYVIPSCAAASTGGCSGALYKVAGGSSPTMPWNGSDKTVSGVGSATLSFDGSNSARFSYVINGVSGSKSIERQSFSNGTAEFGTDYTDLWWNANESGWGIALTQDRGMIFAAWYAYDSGGNPTWYVASACPLAIIPFLGDSCTGNLYQVTGGAPLSGTWNAANTVVTPVGTVSFTFSGASAGTMAYTINGVSASRSITREGF